MGLIIGKVFVEADSQVKVREEIKAHVKKVGAKILTTNEKGAEPEDGRHFRIFMVSPVTDGKVVIWEDGGEIGDMVLAKHLSKALDTKAYWMVSSDIAGGGGYCRYENGKLIESREDYEDDPDGMLEDFAKKYKLPYFWDRFENPNVQTTKAPVMPPTNQGFIFFCLKV